MPELWPSILYPTRVDPFIAPMNQLGPPSTTGGQQGKATDAGFWVMNLEGFKIHTPDQIREWRGLMAALNGIIREVIIGPFDERQAPRLPGQPAVLHDIPHGDWSYFDDEAGYAQSNIEVELAEDAALRATSLTATIVSAGPLRRGMYFSIGNRMYIITSPPVVDEDEATFSFMPPLRADVEAGATLEFARPRALMRLADPMQGRMPVDMGRFADPAIQLVESLEGL